MDIVLTTTHEKMWFDRRECLNERCKSELIKKSSSAFLKDTKQKQKRRHDDHANHCIDGIAVQAWTG
jgi:hypothetical protein